MEALKGRKLERVCEDLHFGRLAAHGGKETAEQPDREIGTAASIKRQRRIRTGE